MENLLLSAFLAVCVAAYSLTVSTAWTLGVGTQARAAVVALHSGRLALVYHAPSFLDPGLIVGTERSAPSARNFLLPYGAKGRRAVISIPLYIPMIAVGGLTAWRWQKRRARTRGFHVKAVARVRAADASY